MDLRQLRYFVVLAEELHFRRAAERLNITQAPLSVAIQNLEQEFGAQLFHRTKRHVAITEVGARFHEHAVSILKKVDLSLRDIKALVSGEAGQLRVGFTASSALLPFFPSLIYDFRMAYPNVNLVLHDLSSFCQIEALQAREIDVGIVRKPTCKLPSDISLTRLVRDELVVAMHHEHRLGRTTGLKLSDLTAERFIFYPRNSGIGIYDHFIELCAKRSFIPQIVQETQDSATILGLTGTGLGIAVVPSGLQCIKIRSVVFKPLVDPDATTDLLLAYRAGESSACITGFRNIAKLCLAMLQRERLATSCTASVA